MRGAAKMRYVLMHKNISVADIELDDATGYISSIGNLHAPEHVPLGIPMKRDEVDRAALNNWWISRSIPASRQGIREALEVLKIVNTSKLLDKSYGLSLSDQYWICPQDSDLTWSKINFFDNDFSEDVGDALFGERPSGDEISLISPDNTSDGWLRKKWKIIDGKRCLIKGGSGATQQEPYNEVLASAIMRRLNILHIPYTLIVENNYPYSVCEDFITKDTELISAWYVMQTQKKQNHVSLYQHFINCCEALDINGIEDSLNKMMTLDYIIVNEDRHQNNFGVIRNAGTLEWIGPAPVFDSGTSMWFDKPLSMIQPTASKLPCKPFKTDHNEQINLVTSFDWLDLSKLRDIDEEYYQILKDSPFIDTSRCDALCYALRKRIEMLSDIVNRHTKYSTIDDMTNEVREDIAYRGKQM